MKKLFKYINYISVGLLSAPIMYGSTYYTLTPEEAEELVPIVVCDTSRHVNIKIWVPVTVNDALRQQKSEELTTLFPQYMWFLQEMNLCNPDGTWNENASQSDINNAYVAFFSKINTPWQISTDLLECVILPKHPNFDAIDHNGCTARHYVENLQDGKNKEYLLDYLERIEESPRKDVSFL